MIRTLARGAVAGAAGTTALNAVTYADMLLRGRPSSDAPARLVAEAVRRRGGSVPGQEERRDNRLQGAGALSGMAVGVGVGVGAAVVASLGRRLGLRPKTCTGALLTGIAAMGASDVPLAGLGISDPRRWSAADWISDAVPHLAYGAVTYRLVSTR